MCCNSWEMGRISPGCQKIKVPKKRGSNRRGCKHGGVCRCKTKTQPPLRVLRRRRLRKRPNIASDVERKTRGRFGQHSWLQDGEQTQRSLAVSQLGRFPRLVQHSRPRNLVSPCTPLCLCVHQATSLFLGALLVCRCRATREGHSPSHSQKGPLPPSASRHELLTIVSLAI